MEVIVEPYEGDPHAETVHMLTAQNERHPMYKELLNG
jgi:hypothetical protein